MYSFRWLALVHHFLVLVAFFQVSPFPCGLHPIAGQEPGSRQYVHVCVVHLYLEGASTQTIADEGFGYLIAEMAMQRTQSSNTQLRAPHKVCSMSGPRSRVWWHIRGTPLVQLLATLWGSTLTLLN